MLFVDIKLDIILNFQKNREVPIWDGNYPLMHYCFLNAVDSILSCSQKIHFSKDKINIEIGGRYT